MFTKTIAALKAAQEAIEEEWPGAQGRAPIRGLFEDAYPELGRIRRELEGYVARPEIAAIQPEEVS